MWAIWFCRGRERRMNYKLDLRSFWFDLGRGGAESRWLGVSFQPEAAGLWINQKKNKKTTAGYISSVNGDNKAGTTGGIGTKTILSAFTGNNFDWLSKKKKWTKYLWPYVSKKKKSTFYKSLDLTCWMPAESNKHYRLLIYISVGGRFASCCTWPPAGKLPRIMGRCATFITR